MHVERLACLFFFFLVRGRRSFKTMRRAPRHRLASDAQGQRSAMVRFACFLTIEPDYPGDRQWEDMAYGVFPMGVQVDGQSLVWGHERMALSAPPATLAGWIRERIPRTTADRAESVAGWSRIRKKNLKDLYLELFVVQRIEQHALSRDQGRELLAHIMAALHFKAMDPSAISFDGSCITDIDGVTFGPGRYDCRVALPTVGADKYAG
jgi:hypothetical protein